MDLKSKIRVIEDFPKEGISFKDITTLMKDREAYLYVIDSMVEDLKNREIDYIVGPEARGFLFGAAVAYGLGVGFIPVRKPGKLPGEVTSFQYELEYGENILEIHKDALEKGAKIAVVDDLLATGGTVAAVAKLIESLGGEVVGFQFLIELESLQGRKLIEKYNINSLVKYDK